MPTAGMRCSGPGFQIGPVRWRQRWRDQPEMLAFDRSGPRGPGQSSACASSVLLRIPLRPDAAEDRLTLRGEIRLQRVPRHESDIFALGIGANRVGWIVEGEA